MTQPAKAQEPSMEENPRLHSPHHRRRRRQQSRRQRVRGAAKAGAAAPPAPPPAAPACSAEPEPQPLRRRKAARSRRRRRSNPPSPNPRKTTAPARYSRSHRNRWRRLPRRRNSRTIEGILRCELRRAEPPGPAPPQADGSSPRSRSENGLLSSATSAAVDSAFNALAQTVLVQNARTLEDLVREMLRPMLKSWLDDNLPGMVERLVRAEIERVARGR